MDWLLKKIPELFFWYTQSLFGNKSVKLKEEKKCIKVGSYYFDLNFISLMPIIFCNISVTGLIFAAVIRYFAHIEMTEVCSEELDCFNSTAIPPMPINDCSILTEMDKVICYHITWRPVAALALVGGFLLIVPKISFQFMVWFNITVAICLKSCTCRCNKCCLICYLTIPVVLYLVSFLLILLVQVYIFFPNEGYLSILHELIDSALSEEEQEQTIAGILIVATFMSCPFSILLSTHVKKNYKSDTNKKNTTNNEERSKALELDETNDV